LPDGLPAWFATADSNGDGQVAMFEYADSWSDGTIEEFRQFDADQDGLITPKECVAATQRGIQRRASGSVAAAPRRSNANTAASPIVAAATTASASIDARYLEYYTKVIANYDKNGDRVLTAEEWKEMSGNEDAARADADGDGRVTAEELVRRRTSS
jgi:hypothetical protein